MLGVGDILTMLSRAESPKPVLFVGAGLSCEIGFPTWTNLIRELAALGEERKRIRKSELKVIEQLLKSGDYLAAGEVLRDRMGRLVDDYLRERFRTLPSDLGSYEYLVRLPYAGIVTTNYDSCIETAYARHFGTPLLTLHPEEPQHMGAVGLGEPFLLKLHGDAKRGTAVLSATDYAVIEQNKPLQTAVASMFLSHPIAFLGYGLSDRDILTPLKLLRSTYTGASTQKLGLLPATLSATDRARLEENFRVDLQIYDPANHHKHVGSMVREAFLIHEESRGKIPALEATDFAEIFTFDPKLFQERLTKRAQDDLSFLDSDSGRWGPFFGSEARAANLAEMLLALAVSQSDGGDAISASEPLRDLLAMTEHGRVKSLSLRVTNLQAQALTLLALVAWREVDKDAALGLESAADWILTRAKPEGWPRFDGDDDTSLVTTLSLLAGLTVAGRNVDAIWSAFRVRLERMADDGPKQVRELDPVIAGWTLIFLHHRWIRGGFDAVDLILRDQMVNVLTQPDLVVDDAVETLPYVESSGTVGWRSWRHPTASICVLALTRWMSELSEKPLRSAIGRCFSKLMYMSTPENSAETFIFPLMYRIMAIESYKHYGYDAMADWQAYP